jgi:ferredoxin
MFGKKVTVRIKNQDKRLEVKSGANLYRTLIEENAIPPTLCGGNGLCGQCKVHISQKNIAKPNSRESLVLAKMNLDAGFRLACQTSVKSDMVVDTSELVASPVIEEVHVKPLQKPVDLIIADREQEPPKKPVINPHVSAFTPIDGLFLNYNSGRVDFFVYSAAVDAITQEGTADNPLEMRSALESGNLSDYIYETLKIKDIDRVIIFMDTPSERGEQLFDLITYYNSDIGSMPCEVIRPLGDTNIEFFLRFLATRDKKRIFIPLDRLDRIYFFKDSVVTRVPFRLDKKTRDIFNLTAAGSNPVLSVSADLKTVRAAKDYLPPDSILPAELMKTAANMAKLKLVDPDLRLYPRNALASSVPLDYVVKMMQYENQPAFSLYRDKNSTLYITQEQLSNLAAARKFIFSAAEFAQASLGSLENVIISTPGPIDDILNGILNLGMIPPRLEPLLIHSAAAPVSTAAKLFLEQDIRTYIRKYYGSYQTSD